MAASTSHQPQHAPFPSRPYTSGLGAGRGQSSKPYNAATPCNAPPQQNPSAIYGAGGAFGGGGTGGVSQQQREAQRLERERAERAERDRREAEERGALDSLSEEERDEINEAVCPLYPN